MQQNWSGTYSNIKKGLSQAVSKAADIASAVAEDLADQLGNAKVRYRTVAACQGRIWYPCLKSD